MNVVKSYCCFINGPLGFTVPKKIRLIMNFYRNWAEMLELQCGAQKFNDVHYIYPYATDPETLVQQFAKLLAKLLFSMLFSAA